MSSPLPGPLPGPTARRRPGARMVGVLAGASLAVAGCRATSGPQEPGDGLAVLASFYPLQYVVEQVGGDRVTIASLTPPGAEPHDVELSPRQVREVGEADVVVVLGGFQPAVDEAVQARSPEHLVDAAATEAVRAHLDEAEPSEGSRDDEHAEDDGQVDGHGHAGDPHFWLDPTLLAAVGHDVAAALGEGDPAHAAEYTERADSLEAELTALDSAYSSALASCDRRVIVTAHEAFGFLAERYDLEQVGISGLDPDSEPSPARLRDIREATTEHGVTTIFTEQLVNPKVARTLAEDLGLTTAVLDPVESQADPGQDYRAVMEQNLESLRTALGCA